MSVWMTIEPRALEGKLLQLAKVFGATESKDQHYKQRAFLGDDYVDKAVNVTFPTAKDRDDFQKVALFVLAHGNSRYQQGLKYGSNLLVMLGRAEVTKDFMQRDIEARIFNAGYAKEYLDV